MMTSMQEYKAHRKALKAQIKETRALLLQLEQELEEEREEMQHDQIEHLEEYMEKAQPHLQDLKTLSTSAMVDLKDSLHNLITWLKGQK